MNFFVFIKGVLLDGKRGLFPIRTDEQALPPALLERVNEKNAVANVKRIVPFAAIIFLIELINQLALLLIGTAPALRGAYLSAGALVMLLTAAAVALAYRVLSVPAVSIRRCKALYRTFWGLFSAAMLLFVCLELCARGSTNNFFYLLILTATFPLLSWREALCLFGLDTVVMLSVALHQGMSAQQLLQFPLIAVFAWVLSRMLYNAYRMNDVMLEQLGATNRRLSTLARTDPLTGLLNRRGIQEQFQDTLSQVEKSTWAAFLMVDIDLFKNYNDRFGHEQGDQCLKRVAGAVQSCVQGPYDVAARFGGEEFLVALVGCGEAAAVEAAQRLRQEVLDLRLEAATDAVSPYVTVSVGVAAARMPFPFTDLYERADKALYVAKNASRNCVALEGRICAGPR